MTLFWRIEEGFPEYLRVLINRSLKSLPFLRILIIVLVPLGSMAGVPGTEGKEKCRLVRRVICLAEQNEWKMAFPGTDSLQLYPPIKCFTKKPDN